MRLKLERFLAVLCTLLASFVIGYGVSVLGSGDFDYGDGYDDGGFDADLSATNTRGETMYGESTATANSGRRYINLNLDKQSTAAESEEATS